MFFILFKKNLLKKGAYTTCLADKGELLNSNLVYFSEVIVLCSFESHKCRRTPSTPGLFQNSLLVRNRLRNISHGIPNGSIIVHVRPITTV